MANTVSVDEMAEAIMEGLLEYAELATDEMKKCVKKAGNTVKKEIEGSAPKLTGKYKKSWRVKTFKESSSELLVVVHSPTRYMLTHLLEKGHAKRGGGRVAAISHIALAEESGIRELKEGIERGLKK